jgi:hypothetical protein
MKYPKPRKKVKTPKPWKARRAPLRPVRKGKEGKRTTLKQGRSTGKPTRAQERRFALMHDIGCICCRRRGIRDQGIEIHHLNLDGKAGQVRLGHDYTIGLCHWHHQGGIPPGVSNREMVETFGPSLKTSRAFREEFGDDDSLLAYQNELIAAQ